MLVAALILNQAINGSALPSEVAASAQGDDPQQAAQPTTSAPDPNSDIKTVTVSGKRKAVEVDLDRKVYNISNDLQSVTGTAADVLNTIPSVQVDADGNVSLRGDNRVVILIDGKPSAQLSGANAGDGLLQYGANDIERIEVMTNAPAEYGANGTAGVINIVTRRNRQPGTSGAFVFNAGNDGRYVSDLRGALNSENLKLSGGIGLRQDDRERDIQTTINSFASATTPASQSDENLHEEARRLTPSVKGGLEYELNEDQSLDMDFRLRQRSGHRYYNAQDMETLVDGSLADETLGHSVGHEWSLSGEKEVRFRQNLSSPDETLDLTLHRTTDKERERYQLTTLNLVPAAAVSGSQLYQNHHFITNDFSADYKNSFDATTALKLGYNVQHDNDAFNNAGNNLDAVTGQWMQDPTQNNQFNYLQTIQALYASWQQKWGAWQVLAGTRAEHTETHADQVTSNQVNQHSYTGLYPSLHAEQQLDPVTTVLLIYSRRLSRPDPDDLNPYIDYRDPNNLQSGNPNLLPQQSQSIEAGYRVDTEKLGYGMTGYVKQIKDSFTVETVQVAPNVLLTSKANLPRSNAAGFELAMNGMLSPSLSYRIAGNLFDMQVQSDANGVNTQASTHGINLKSSLDYRPNAYETAQVSFIRADRQLTAQGSIAAINLVNVGYKYQLRSDLSLVFTVSDLFNGHRQIRTVNAGSFNETYDRFQAGRIAMIGFSYSFGVTKKSKADGFEYDQPQN